MPSGKGIVQKSFAVERPKTHKMFRNKVEKQVLQDFFGFQSKRMDGGNVKGIIMLIARLDALVEAIEKFLWGAKSLLDTTKKSTFTQ